MSATWNNKIAQEAVCTYSLDVIFDHTSDSFSMFNILLCNDCQIPNLVPIVCHEVFEGVFIVISDLIRGKSSRHEGRRGRGEWDTRREEEIESDRNW